MEINKKETMPDLSSKAAQVRQNQNSPLPNREGVWGWVLQKFILKLEILFDILKSFLDWVYYQRCYFCGKTSRKSIMCDLCFNLVKTKLKPVRQYKVLGKIEIFSAFVYKEEILKLIRGIKFHNRKELAPYAAGLLYEYWQNTHYADRNFVIIPMPSHEKRLKKRKYNHIELIAEEFSKLTGYAVNTELVHKIKDTKPQYQLSRAERQENLHGAFSVNEESYGGENLLLLDDICTTGVTMQEIIKALNKKGITKLCGLVLSNPE